jgi:hypothetical protein
VPYAALHTAQVERLSKVARDSASRVRGWREMRERVRHTHSYVASLAA